MLLWVISLEIVFSDCLLMFFGFIPPLLNSNSEFWVISLYSHICDVTFFLIYVSFILKFKNVFHLSGLARIDLSDSLLTFLPALRWQRKVEILLFSELRVKNPTRIVPYGEPFSWRRPSTQAVSGMFTHQQKILPGPQILTTASHSGHPMSFD